MRRFTLAALASAGLFAHVSVGMYADDAGKLDWHRENLGRLVSAGFDGRGGLTVVGEVRQRGHHLRTQRGVGWLQCTQSP